MAKLDGNAPLCETDPELYDLIKHEKRRQKSCLELIASENFTSKAVMEAVSLMMSYHSFIIRSIIIV